MATCGTILIIYLGGGEDEHDNMTLVFGDITWAVVNYEQIFKLQYRF
jgi:hypothetical protein